MLTLDELRSYATGLPGVTEQPHFGQPAFRVRDKLVLSVHVDRDDPVAIIHVSEDDAASAIAADPAVGEEVWRTHGERRIFVGLRIDLTATDLQGAATLVELAWRRRAPKRLLTEYDDT